MYGPIRCFNCGKVLGDKWLYWEREIAKIKGLKAESGENQVILNWKSAKNSIQYYVYQNGALEVSTLPYPLHLYKQTQILDLACQK